MRFDVISLFPEMFEGYVRQSILKLAIAAGRIDVRLHDLRDWADDKHAQVDDRPFGGGPGMVLRVDRVVPCVRDVQAMTPDAGRLILLSPQGRRFDQRCAQELAGDARVVLVCGRYEGFDERIRELLQPDEVSIGDYVLNGGEVAAMVVIDTVMRLVPGVLGDEQSSEDDSFARAGGGLEFAQYTRPREYEGMEVPDVLLGGNHAEIAQWRENNSRQRTARRRPDLLEP